MLTSKSDFLKIELSLQRGLEFSGFGGQSWKQKSIKNRSFPGNRSRDATKMPQDAPKTPPRCPKTPQDAPKTPPRAPKTLPRAPKTPPRRPQERPRRPQDAPRGFKKQGKNGRKRHHRPKSRPNHLQTSILERFGVDLGGFWGRFLKDLGWF